MNGITRTNTILLKRQKNNMESAAYLFRPGNGWIWILAALILFLAWKAITNCMFQPRHMGDNDNLTIEDFYNHAADPRDE